MAHTKIEGLSARIKFKYASKDSHEGRDIAYIYNRKQFDTLEIPVDKFENSQFIEIGQEINLEGHKCKVVNMNFKFYDQVNSLGDGDYNCQVLVLVERLD